MDKVTIVMPYYDNPNMLLHHLEEWSCYMPADRARVRVIIVDDASPNDPAEDVIVGCGEQAIDIEVYRVLKDIPWGQDGARNIGMHQCKTSWALLTDMDHVLFRDQVTKLLDMAPDRKCYYMPERRWEEGIKHPHPNSFLIHKHDFWRMGGYDEDFVGWYGSDGNFRKCCKGSGLTEVTTSAFFLYEFNTNQIKDCNTKAYQRKDGQHYAPLNPGLDAKRRGPPYRATNPFRLPYERVL